MKAIATQGIVVPRLGLGTYRMQGDECRAAVESALEIGYRHIDTAEMYGNEDAVGAAIAASSIARQELHVTTKVWHQNLAPDAIRASLNNSLAKLGLDYVDMYMIHWPAPGMNLPAMFDTLQALRAEGRIRAMGVCNFTLPLLREVIEHVKAPIAFNQIEYHVLLDQSAIRSYLAAHSIPIMAHVPLAQGTLSQNAVLQSVARKHGVEPAQVALKWLLDQDGVAAVPKARRLASQRANLASWEVQLDDEDRALIASLPKDKRFVVPSFAPIWDKPSQ